MKTNKENIDLIEKYLDDKLDREELERFNMKLKEDPEFHQLYFDMDRLVEGIRISASKSTLEEKLTNLEKSLPFQKNGNRDTETPEISLWERTKRYRMPIAAAIALFIVSAIILRIQDAGMDPEKLYAKYYEPFENYSGTTRSLSEQEMILSKKAFQYYDLGEYRQALDIFEQLENQSEGDGDPSVSRWLYMGITYLELSEPENAIPMFDKVIDSGSGLVAHAKWYLALSYLKQENIEAAKPLFRELADQGRFKSKESGEILHALD